MPTIKTTRKIKPLVSPLCLVLRNFSWLLGILLLLLLLFVLCFRHQNRRDLRTIYTLRLKSVYEFKTKKKHMIRHANNAHRDFAKASLSTAQFCTHLFIFPLNRKNTAAFNWEEKKRERKTTATTTTWNSPILFDLLDVISIIWIHLLFRNDCIVLC